MSTERTGARNFSSSLRRIAGTASPKVILHFVLVNIALGTAASGLYDLAKSFGGRPQEWFMGDWGAAMAAIVIPFAYISVLVRRLTWDVDKVQHEIRQDSPPKKSPALVLFLSDASEDKELTEKLLAAEDPGCWSDMATRERFKSSRRMVLEALAHHCPRVLVAVPSTITRGDYDAFRTLVLKMKPKTTELAIPELHEIPGFTAPDFNKAREVDAALRSVYAWLYSKGFPDSDILMDITGGTKVASVVGALLSEADDRKIQYVTGDYRLYTYDVERL